jgi:hypothetical protein
LKNNIIIESSSLAPVRNLRCNGIKTNRGPLKTTTSQHEPTMKNEKTHFIKVWGLGFMVQGLGFRVQGLGSRVLLF